MGTGQGSGQCTGGGAGRGTGRGAEGARALEGVAVAQQRLARRARLQRVHVRKRRLLAAPPCVHDPLRALGRGARARARDLVAWGEVAERAENERAAAGREGEGAARRACVVR